MSNIDWGNLIAYTFIVFACLWVLIIVWKSHE